VAIARNILFALAPAIDAVAEYGLDIQQELIDNLNAQLEMAGFQLEYTLSPDGSVAVCHVGKKGVQNGA